MATDHTRPSAETRAEEAKETASRHDADRAATPDEERGAERNRLDPDAARAARDAAERGAANKGEGRIP